MTEDGPKAASAADGHRKAGLSWREGIPFVLAVWAASRLLYLFCGPLFATVVPVGWFYRLSPDTPFGTLNIWSHWDGVWYIEIAGTGYGASAPESTAFFPLYPLLVRTFAELFGGPISLQTLSLWAPLISLLLLPFALYFLYQIALEGWGERVGRGAVVAVAFFPTTFFLHSAYTESLFLTLSAGCVWAMRVRKDIVLACLLAGLASGTRNVGIFLVVPLALGWLEERDRYGWRGLYLALAPTGLVAYMGYLWWRFGDPLLFYSAQEYWNRRHAGPVALLIDIFGEAFGSLRSLFDARSPASSTLEGVVNRLHGANDAYSLLFLLFTLGLLGLGFRVLPLSLSLYTLLLVFAAVTYGKPATPLFGFSRYILVAFPLFITLAALLESRRAVWVWLSFSTAISLVFCAFFVSWRFVA